MLRPINMADLTQEFERMRELNERQGTPFLEPYFQRILMDGWLDRNSHIYQLYEIQGILYGYWSVIPLTRRAYLEFMSGRRCPWRDLRTDEILPDEAYSTAVVNRQPICVWIESFTHTDEHAFRIVGQHLLDHLRQLSLEGLLAESSNAYSETNCRFFGLELLHAYDKCHTGTRKVWFAPITALTRPEWPFGPPSKSLELSNRQKEVAQLFYISLCNHERLTEKQVGNRLGIGEDAVSDHLKKIRSKAQDTIGTSDRDRLSLWFHLHPSELLIEDRQSPADPSSR